MQRLKKAALQIAFMATLFQCALCVPPVEADYSADCLAKAKSALARNDIAQAEQLVSDVDEKACSGDKLADFLFLKGEIARLQRSHTEAIQYFKRAKAIRSDYSTLLSLAMSSYEIADYAQSASFAAQGLKLKPDEPKLYLVLGRSRAHMGNLQGALEIFTKSLKVAEPTSSSFKNALRERAAVYLAMELPEQAQKDLVELNKLPLGKKASLEGIYSLSFKYSRDFGKFLGGIGEAATRAGLERVKQKMARNPKPEELKDLRLQEAELEMYSKHYDRAIELLNVAQKLGDDSYRLHSIKAGALMGLKQYDQARYERKTTIDLYISQRLNESKKALPSAPSPFSGKGQQQ